jgi:hypothetical protein
MSPRADPLCVDGIVIARAEFLFDRFRDPRRVFGARHVACVDTRRPTVICDGGV